MLFKKLLAQLGEKNRHFLEVLLTWRHTVGWVLGYTTARIWIQLLFFFYILYFGHQGQLNEATRQLSKLPLHLGYRGCSEPLVGSKPNLMKNLTMQHLKLFWNTAFKVSKLWHWNPWLHLQTKVPKYKIFDVFREKKIVSQTNFIKFFHKMYMEEMLEYISVDVPTIQTVVKHGWMQHYWKGSNLI